MRVRILSGNGTGSVVDVPQVEGECLVTTGFAELVVTTPKPIEEPSPAELLTDGPTFEQFVAAGYPPEHYRPRGYAVQHSAGWDAYREEALKGTTPAMSESSE